MVEAQSVVERPTKRKRDRSNLSKLARARKVQFPDTSFEDAPEIAANAGVRTDARLRDAAAMTHRGEDALSLRGDIVTGLGTTGRGLLGVTCDHYLPANRFAWWDVDKAGGVPDTGRIGDTADLRKTFCDEFCSSLATVVGADLDGPFRSSKAHKVPWDGLRSGSSPNNTPLMPRNRVSTNRFTSNILRSSKRSARSTLQKIAGTTRACPSAT